MATQKPSSGGTSKTRLRRMAGNQPPVRFAPLPPSKFGGGSNAIAARAVRIARGGKS
jgi:hypothetical protein